jgi:uncharacterized RDD family membrane protein YckC
MTNAPAAGWYDDPNTPAQNRYFDGSTWTEQTRPIQPMPNFPVAIQSQQPAMASTQVLNLPAGTNKANPLMRLVAYFLEALLLVVTLGIGWLVWAAMTAPTGQTPAKRILGQRVISARSIQPVGFAKMFWVRGILGGIIVPVILTISLGILIFMPFWDRRNQNLWDKISGTYVVDDLGDAWNMKPAL